MILKFIIKVFAGILITVLVSQQSFFTPQSAVAASTGQTGYYYIVFEKVENGTIAPRYIREVTLSAPLSSLTDDRVKFILAQPNRNSKILVALLQNEYGQIVFQTIISTSPWLRGEFTSKDPNTTIDGHLIPLETSSFVVRVPKIEGTRLVFKNTQQEQVAQFEMQSLASEIPQIKLESSSPLNMVGANGPSENRVDFLIMGDGYSSAEATKFNNDAANIAANFFSISPYSIYRNYFNVLTLFTPSSQSGADHPPYNASCGYYDPTCCGDPAMLSDPLRGTIVNTAFDARFCAYYIHRLLVINQTKVLAAASAVPDWDNILVIVNDTTYGGSGGPIAVVSTNSYAVQIAQHEYGHSFVNLADEYDDANPGYPPCSDLGGSNTCEANVTDVTDRLQIKWSPWINANTQIPTPNDPGFNGLVGLFQGARYLKTGMYRSGYDCIMRSMGAPYCQVPSQAFVLRLYNGGWGDPAVGISPIEPGSISPNLSIINMTIPATQVLQVTPLGPIGGPPVKITWFENGIPIDGATGSSYSYITNPSKLGTNQITVEVSDVTTLVNSTMAGEALSDSFTWTINVSSSLFPPIFLPLINK